MKQFLLTLFLLTVSLSSYSQEFSSLVKTNSYPSGPKMLLIEGDDLDQVSSTLRILKQLTILFRKEPHQVFHIISGAGSVGALLGLLIGEMKIPVDTLLKVFNDFERDKQAGPSVMEAVVNWLQYIPAIGYFIGDCPKAKWDDADRFLAILEQVVSQNQLSEPVMINFRLKLLIDTNEGGVRDVYEYRKSARVETDFENVTIEAN